MHENGLIDFLGGGTMVALCVIGVFFLRFWFEGRDRLFLFFAGAFFLLAVSQITLVLFGNSGDQQPIGYWLRFIAFLMIMFAIVEKNLPAKKKSDKD
jgi:hypothetical protein